MSEMGKYLFLGGKADGQMIMLNRNHIHHQIPYLDVTFSGKYHEHIPVKAELYRKIKWECGDSEIFEFYTLESLSNSEVMSIILNNYQPKQDNDIKNRFREYEIMLERCVEEFGEMVKNPFRFKETIEFVDKICEFLQFRRNKN